MGAAKTKQVVTARSVRDIKDKKRILIRWAAEV